MVTLKRFGTLTFSLLILLAFGFPAFNIGCKRPSRDTVEQETDTGTAQRSAGEIYQQGKTYFSKEPPLDVSEAMRLFHIAADMGYVDAQNRLGSIYSRGIYDGPSSRHVTQDDKEAIKWYRLAAEQGDTRAMISLGSILFDSGGVHVRDIKEAEKWYRLAAEQGERLAQHSLGLIYCHGGVGITRDFNEASKWFSLAKKQGLKTDYFMIVQRLIRDEDYQEALKWFRLAELQGSKIHIARRLIDLNEAKDYQELAKWQRIEAELGKPADQYSVGNQSYDRQDYKEAIKWYRLAAENEQATSYDWNREARKKLAYMYSKGIGVPKDNAEAEKWSSIEAQRGDPREQYLLAERFLDGDSIIAKDFKKALKWYRMAADQKNSDAMATLAFIFLGRHFSPYTGAGLSGGFSTANEPYKTNPDYEKAFFWLHLITTKNHYPRPRDLPRPEAAQAEAERQYSSNKGDIDRAYDNCRRRLSPKQLSDIKQKAEQLWKR